MDAVADEIGRRFMASIEQENAVVKELELGEALFSIAAAGELAGADERGEYLPLIIGVGPRAASDEVAEVILELSHRPRAGFEPFLGKDRLQSAEDCQRPTAQGPPLGVRYS